MSPSSLAAVTGSFQDVIPIRRVLVSVFDKTGIVEFCTLLQTNYTSIEFLSTGGTAKILRDAGLQVQDVSDYTGSIECLDGRVKTLHPKIHGGLLAVRGNEKHNCEMKELQMSYIDMTIVNLYPFEKTCQRDNATYDECIENIDIGGPSMIRSTAKNHTSTTIVTSPSQYELVKSVLLANNGGTTYELRKYLAAAAFAATAQYDSAIASYLHTAIQPQQLGVLPAPVVTRAYEPAMPLKYGCNPHQKPASILRRVGSELPFDVLNGTPGYINLLDACNAFQLVTELREATGLPAAASFKHVSPAGAAVAVELSDVECLAYEVTEATRASLTPVALAYLRARNADPMCSYGDFAAVSDVVDEATAAYLKTAVCDGIIAPGYTAGALEVLAKKKSGAFIVLRARLPYDAGLVEYREVYGMGFSQRRNDCKITSEIISRNVVTGTDVAPDTVRDLVVASICVKYTQSNSVGFAKSGQMVGVGAGQQSRVDCVKLAGRKVRTWFLRQHPKVLDLPFRASTKRQDRVNARVRYIEGDFTVAEKAQWDDLFETVPEPLSETEKDEYMVKVATGVSISSDAFFPFRDSIDHASKYGVSAVVQPGGSVQDAEVIAACKDYNITMTFTNLRLFHH